LSWLLFYCVEFICAIPFRLTFSDKLRFQLALAGYMEVLTFSLCSKDENYAYLRQADDGLAVVLANPATQARGSVVKRECDGDLFFCGPSAFISFLIL
jgi:hypothetical protein